MGIVGPNGCGKSNVIDAIRWVLGESSAKTLRGDSMADVIFNGSSGRKPVGQASIELIFDNSDGTITGAYAGYAEVSVRRVVSRDGTSQYFLNHSRCRRKDITHILLGTGLGSHGYSIIEQGMISRLVEAKPEDLRSFLEEAAGISKYKERRRETEHRIRHTRDNLERLTDLREELDKQLAHLQRQARAAERYKLLKADQRRTHAELLMLRLNGLQASLADEEAQLRARQNELDAAVTEQGELDATIEKLRVELAEDNDRFNAAQGVYYRVGAEIARLEQSIQHRKATISRQQNEIDATEQQLAEISGHIDNDRLELEQLEQVLRQLNPELEQATGRLREAEQALADVESRVDRDRARLEALAREIALVESETQVEQARIEQLTARRSKIEADQTDQMSARESIRFDELEARVDALVRTEEQQREGCAEVTRALDRIWEEIRRLRSEESSLSEGLDGYRERLQRDRGRLSSLEALQEAALGKLSDAADRWLTEKSLDGSPRLAETLAVEPGWERAAETALSGYLHALRVDRLEAIEAELPDLTDSGLALLEENREDTELAPSGALPALATKVTAPAGVAALLGGYFAAESLTDAMRYRASLRPGQAIVTRDGALVGPHSVRTNRDDDPQLGVLARGEEIERLKRSVSEIAAKSDQAAARLGTIRGRLDELEAQRAEKQIESGERQEAYTETKTQLEGTRARLDDARLRASALDESIAAIGAELEEIDATVASSRQKRTAAAERREQLLADRAVLEEDRDRLQDALLEARGNAEHERERVKEIAIQVEARRSSKESAAAALERVQSQRVHLDQRRSNLTAQLDEVREPLEGEEAELRLKLDERLTSEEDLASARSTVEQCESRVRETEARRTEMQQKVSAAREMAQSARLAVREVQVRADTVKEQLSETGFELETLAAELDADATIESWSEKMESIERRIQRLGSINLAAIDEFEEQSERKQYLDKQHADLTDALDTLEAAIRKIDRETRSRFKETFDKANQGLGRLFPRLFGGGHAYLELDSEDLLAAGVSIMARPPGKRISTIHLLSGGEKALTAVALVFSIFELNPAPFCLLDEVDAPLDDANVGRFSEIVREMSDQVQFVLITHNKTTMEAMQQLSGVTMHEPGVSRLVAVDIDEAVKLAAM